MREKVTLEIEPIENGFLVTLNQEQIVAVGHGIGKDTKVTKNGCNTFYEALRLVYTALTPHPEKTFDAFIQEYYNPNEENPE